MLPRAALRDLVNGLGKLELAPDRSMRYTDKTQNYRIDLEGGLQDLNGSQVEQLLRFRDAENGQERRRERQQMVVESVLRQMGQRRELQQLPELLAGLQNQVETNLTQSEALSLLAVALNPSTSVRFSSLPLRPPLQPEANPNPKQKQPTGPALRQLNAQALQPWPR